MMSLAILMKIRSQEFLKDLKTTRNTALAGFYFKQCAHLLWVCMARFWQWGGGGYWGGFCEKLQEASLMSDKSTASRL